jgi:hypothetical protein
MEIIESNASDVVISMYCTIPTKCSVTHYGQKKKPAFKIHQKLKDNFSAFSATKITKIREQLVGIVQYLHF